MIIFKSGIERLSMTVVLKDGRHEFVSFEPNGYPETHGEYYCYDNEVAEAIKKLPEFGTVITVEGDESVIEPEVEVAQYVAEYPDVKRTQDANKILVNEYGVDRATLSSREEALEAAKLLHINFPNL